MAILETNLFMLENFKNETKKFNNFCKNCLMFKILIDNLNVFYLPPPQTS